jgi:hypothetical protein
LEFIAGVLATPSEDGAEGFPMPQGHQQRTSLHHPGLHGVTIDQPTMFEYKSWLLLVPVDDLLLKLPQTVSDLRTPSVECLRVEL